MSDAKNEAVEALGNLLNPTDEEETATTEKPEELETEVTEVETPDESTEETDEDKPGKDWKATARLWQDRSKANKAAADELPKVQEKLEASKKELAEQKKATADAQASLLRYKIATKYAITEEHMELFLTGSDEETLERQAAALSERTVKTPRPDRAQGNRNGSGATTNKQRFADTLSQLGL